MPVATVVFTTADYRAIKGEYRQYVEEDGRMPKRTWSREKAAQLGCHVDTIRKIVQSIPSSFVQRPYTDEDTQQLIALSSQGMKDAVIAKRMGRTVVSIKRKRQSLGINTKHDASLPAIIERIKKLAILGYYDKEIAADLGLHPKTVYNHRRKRGIKCGRNRPAYTPDPRLPE